MFKTCWKFCRSTGTQLDASAAGLWGPEVSLAYFSGADGGWTGSPKKMGETENGGFNMVYITMKIMEKWGLTLWLLNTAMEKLPVYRWFVMN